jgi:OFA family oxalate/formate antiporter-like MFS transporter
MKWVTHRIVEGSNVPCSIAYIIGGKNMWLKKGVTEEKRWFYPISAFTVGVIVTVTALWTLFYPHIQMHFGLDTAATIVLGATFSGIGSMILAPPIAGIILDKYGPKINFILAALFLAGGHVLISRMLKLTDWSVAMYYWYIGSFLIGFGTGFFAGTHTATVGKWFPDKTGTAMGLAVAGAGTGTIIYSPLVAAYIRANGFNGTIFLFFAVISAAAMLFIMTPFWRTPEHDWLPKTMQGQTTAAKAAPVSKDFTFEEAIRDKRFWVMGVCFVCAAFSLMFFTQNVTLIILEGLSDSTPTETILTTVIPLFLTIQAFSGLVGRFSWGVISDKMGGPWKTLWLVYLIPAILMAIFYLGYNSVFLIYVVGFLFFFISGGEPVIHYAIVPHVFGRRHLGKIMNIINAFTVGVGVASGPFVGAYIKDITGGYVLALVLAIVIRLIGTAFALYGLKLDKKRNLVETTGTPE